MAVFWVQEIKGRGCQVRKWVSLIACLVISKLVSGYYFLLLVMQHRGLLLMMVLTGSCHIYISCLTGLFFGDYFRLGKDFQRRELSRIEVGFFTGRMPFLSPNCVKALKGSHVTMTLGLKGQRSM